MLHMPPMRLPWQTVHEDLTLLYLGVAVHGHLEGPEALQVLALGTLQALQHQEVVTAAAVAPLTASARLHLYRSAQ